MAGNDLGSLLGSLLGGGGQQSGGGGGGGATGASGGAGGSGGAVNVLGALLGALMSKGGTSAGAATGVAGGGAGGSANPLGGLLDMLKKSGLVDQAQSWVGHGQNQPVTGAQVREALPDDTLGKVAEEAGVSPDKAADQLASVLPQAVDKLTPEGQVPQASLEDIIKQQRV
ncbi:YidB family protein [Streptomyces sp. NPDC059477]|uniref:YidB family protein n=1 Tax=Streptomyces sp. NPDC059477 TaxID=3346847 RepID=UPI0036C5DE8C